MAKSPAFSFYPKDYESDESVKLMSLEQEGAYLRLLCHAWLHGSIPTEVPALARIVRTTTQKMNRLWPGIAPCWKSVDGRLVNGRQERERQAQSERRELASQKGKKGASKRWPRHSPGYRSAKTRAMPSDSFPSPSPSASATDNGNRPAPAAPDAGSPSRFPSEKAADIWNSYYPDGKPQGAMFKALRPLVMAKGWDVVEPELRAYIERTEIGVQNWNKFASGFGSWTKAPPPRGQATANNTAVLDQWEREVMEGKR